MSYRDHRSQRVRTQWLDQRQLIKRILEHVPATGIHTVRYAGLYASASKQHAQALKRFGNLDGQRTKSGVVAMDRLVCCKRCGAPAELIGQRWRKLEKGISYIKQRVGIGAGGHVQQGVESDNERDVFGDSS